MSLPRPPIQRHETPKNPLYLASRGPREVRARRRRHTHDPSRHSMNTNEAVASEVAAPAASEGSAPVARQDSVGVGPAGPDSLPVATPAGSAPAEVQLGTLPSSKTLRSSMIPWNPIVAASRPGSHAVAGSRTKNPVGSRGGRIPLNQIPLRPGVATYRPGEYRGVRIPYKKNVQSRGCRIPYKQNTVVPWLPDPVQNIP